MTPTVTEHEPKKKSSGRVHLSRQGNSANVVGKEENKVKEIEKQTVSQLRSAPFYNIQNTVSLG